MSTNVANVVQAVSDTVPTVPFINWQYMYCLIVSIFGGSCTSESVDVSASDHSGVVRELVSSTTNGGVDPGFWSWLWPFGFSHDVASGIHLGGAEESMWSSILSQVPEPVALLFRVLWDVCAVLWTLFSGVSYTVSGLLFCAIIVAATGLIYTRIAEWKTYNTLPPRPSGKNFGWSRWQDLLDATMSKEPKRWHDGIVAADRMLGELLERLGYVGDGTHVQLSRVTEGAFVTLPQAWEAHRVHNFVSQKNSNFILTQREAFRVMKLYEQVFEEFDFI